MALTQDQAERFWLLFQDSPLFATWPEAQFGLPSRMDPQRVRAGEKIFRKEDRPDYLYLVIEGRVQQTLQRPGSARPWLRKESGPGRFFGQHSLLFGQHVSEATALVDTLLLRMSAADLRFALERNDDLHDYLLPEKRSGRLRGIPLLRTLQDDEIRWLSQLVQEEKLERDRSLDLESRPGLWIINHGLVQVTGPASMGRQNWRLTAGNFFFSLHTRWGAACAAESAISKVDTELFYLPEVSAERLVEGFDDIQQIVSKPLDIAGILEQHAKADESTTPKILSDPYMDTAHFQHLAQFCAWEFVPAGLTITTQGSIGHSFVLLKDGAAIVIARDQQGRMRPQNYLAPVTSYGETSLLEGRERDATVRAVAAPEIDGQPGLPGAELLLLDRRDLEFAFQERRDLWHPGGSLFDKVTSTRKAQQPFDWLDEGESVIWQGRGHSIWLLGPQLMVWLFFLIVLGLASAIPERGLSSDWAIALLVVAGMICVPLAIWILINYYDDYYMVTNRRVTRRDRRLLLQESRVEAPIDMVQDVSIDIDFYGRLFGYADLTIRTAAEVRTITFAHVPEPERVSRSIYEEKAEALAASTGQRKEILRRDLIGGLQLILPVPERVNALGKDIKIPRPISWWDRLWQRLITRESLVFEEEILWRKHWVNLVQRTGAPFLFIVIPTIIAVIILVTSSLLPGLSAAAVLLGWLAIFVPGILWFLYQFVDYRNDIYIVTNDKLIDIEKKPLWLSEQRRQASLDRVQTVFAQQDGFWANALNFGDVFIRTAASDEGLTFEFVGNPKQVQATVFRKLEAFRRQQQERRVKDFQRELIEGLEVYHELRGEQRYPPDARPSLGRRR